MDVLAQICSEAFGSEEDPDVIQGTKKAPGRILAMQVVQSITRGGRGALEKGRCHLHLQEKWRLCDTASGLAPWESERMNGNGNQWLRRFLGQGSGGMS